MNPKIKLVNVLNIRIAVFLFLATLSVVVGLSSNPAEARPFAYVPNHLAGTVSVIDTNPSSLNFNKVVSTIQVGGDPNVIASVPDGTRAYVTSRNSGTIMVIDTNPGSLVFNKVVSTIQVEGNSGMIAVTPDGTRAYVTSRNSRTITVIDTNPGSLNFNKVVSTIDMPQHSDWIAITPDGTRAYLTSRNAGTVTVIDTNPGSIKFNKVESTIRVGGDPNTIAFTPDGSRAYVLNPRTHTVTVIDTNPSSPSYNRAVTAIGACSFPSGIAFTPDGNHAYLTNHDSGTVSRIGTNPGSADFNKVGPVIAVGPNPDVIAITPDGSHIYVVADHRSVVVIDTSNNSVLETLAIKNGLSWAAIVPSVDLPPNLPPVANAGGPYTVGEGGSVLLTGAATDPDYHPLTFTWDLDIDGTFETTGPSVIFNAAGFDGPSFHTVVLKVTDIGGLSDTSEATITINNVPPTLASVVNDGPVNEGSLVRVTASATDSSPDSLTYFFDFDNDGVFEVSQGISAATHIYPENGSFTVKAQVRDDDGGASGILTTVVVVNTVAPTINAGVDQSADEGTSIAFTGSFTDPGADTHTFSWHFGDGSPAVTDSLTPVHTYMDNGTFNVTLTVTDDDGGAGTDTLTVTVNNVAPTTEAGPDQTVNEGETVSLTSATFIDPGIQDTHTATINWDDGSPVEAGAVNASTVSGSHVYPDDGVFTVDVCVSDDDGGVDCDSFQVNVNNVAPTINAGVDQSADEGTSIAFTGSFTDPGADTHTFSWHFGDGSPAVTDSLTPVHTYKDNGTFNVTLTVTDDDGGAGTDTVIVTVKNVPPVISVSGSATVDEGSPMALNMSASDDGEDDVVNLEASGLPDGSSFTPTPGNPATGTLRWTPAFTQSGSYERVTFTATDNDGGTHIRTVTLIVNETGQPVLAVTNLIDDTVSLIDQQVNEVVSTVEVGHHPVAAAFYDHHFDGSNPHAKLYVVKRNDDALSVLESTSASALALSKVIQVGNRPTGVGVSPQGTQVWVANRNGDSLSIIDPATDTVMVTVPLRLQGSSRGRGGDVEDDRKSVALGFSPDDQYAYVAARNSGTLVVVDKAQALADPANAVVASVEVGDMPEALAVDPAGGLVYVANWNGRNVSVVDVSSPTVPVVLAMVAVGKHPEGMALLSDGSKLYVTNRDSDTVSVFEVGPAPFYLTLVKTIAVGKKPSGIAATRDGSFVSGDFVYVANRIEDTVSVIDAVTDQVIATIPVGKHPSGVAVGIMPTAP